jgi:Transposase DDE domain
VLACGDVSLVLYDVTTLYFEAEHEDGLRKVGYSKERRVDPQIVVGLLVDRQGFPLEIGCFEGNKAEKHTILPVISQFRARHGIENFAVVADAGMLSAANLAALDTAGCKFIVGSRLTKAPIDLESHFRWHGDYFGDGQVIDTLTPKTGRNCDNDPALLAEPVWDPRAHPASWRAVWAYSRSRAVRDTKTLTAQENRAGDVITGGTAARMPRFVKTAKGRFVLDQAALARARRLAGLKGYVTNIPATVMPATEVITSYHDLWHVEQSFRMSKTDLAARPMFARTRDAIEAHLTIVFTALASPAPCKTAPATQSAGSSEPCGRCARRPSRSTAPPTHSRPHSAPTKPPSSTRCETQTQGTKADGLTQDQIVGDDIKMACAVRGIYPRLVTR